MTAYSDYYIDRIEDFLKKELTEEENDICLRLYILGWHPIRVAKYIQTGKDE